MFRSKPVFTNSLCYLVATLVFLFACGTVNAQEMECNRTIIAYVVALDQPVLSMLWEHDGIIELIYSDLTAMITGKNRGRFELPLLTSIPAGSAFPSSKELL